MQRPTRGEIVILACAAFLLATSPLKLWGRYDCPTCPAEARWSQVNVWSQGFSVVTKVAFVLAAALVIVVILRLFNLGPSFAAGRVYVGIGLLVTLLLVIAAVAGPSDLGFGHTSLLDVSRGPLLLVGWLAGVGMIYGGLLHMRRTLLAERREARGPVVLR